MDILWNQLLLRIMSTALRNEERFESIVRHVKIFYLRGEGSVSDLRETTLKLCTQLIENKWIDVIDMETEPCCNVLDLATDEMMALIDARWKRIGYGEPEVFDVFWYMLTEEGEKVLERLEHEHSHEAKPPRRRKRE
jgi:hypothetical protein